MTLPKKIEQKHMDKLGKSRSKKEHERYKSCVGLSTLPSPIFMLSFYDSIVRWLILNQDKNGSLLGHRIHRMIQDPSNAYTGRSMKKSRIAQAMLVLESPVGGLVITMKSLCESSPNRSSMA